MTECTKHREAERVSKAADDELDEAAVDEACGEESAGESKLQGRA